MSQLNQSILNKSRADKFLLVFDIPPILKTFSQTNSTSIRFAARNDQNVVIPDSVQFSIFGTLVPEITVPAIENRYAGNTLYVSSNSKNSYPPVNVKFNVDNQYKNYWTIYKWLNLLHDQSEGKYNADNITVDDYFGDYQTDLTIYGLDEYDNKVIKFTYTKAFPTSIDALNFNYQESGEITCGFVFVYSQMHVEILKF